jgi:Methyltransferase domain
MVNPRSDERDPLLNFPKTNNTSPVVADIIRVAPSLHRAGTFSRTVLEALYRHASTRRIMHSAETGSGASTLLFSHLSESHTVFALDYGTDSVRAVQASPLLRPGVVTFVDGATQLTLPTHRFDHKLQLVLIDGPHAYPFPDLEYYYFYPHLDADALLIVDDIHIKSVHNLFDFLSADDMFRLEEVIENTAIFSRTEASTFSPIGDGWETQRYNGQDFAIAPARPGASDRLKRVSTPTAFYLDELGPLQNPSRHFFLRVPALQSLLVAGWAIDEQNRCPAACIEIVLDGSAYRTEARVPRGDVAAAHGADFLRCGFRTELPADCIVRGRHLLAIRVILQGGRSYYQSPEFSFTAK